MANLGIPGELHERPWRNFGHNRSEALTLAQGHGDYIWVMDADDTVVGTPDFGGLSADVYNLRYGQGARFMYWRRHLFRDGLRWRYEGVVHEYAVCDDPFVEERLDGEYYIDSRRLGARNLDPQKYARDRDLLLAEVERNPDDGAVGLLSGPELLRSVRFRQRARVVCAAGGYGWLGRGGLLRDVPGRRVDVAARCTVAGRSGCLPAGLGISTDPRGAPARHRLPVPHRSALPARPPVCRAGRRNPVARRGHIVCRRRRLRLARGRRAVGLRILDRQAHGGIHVVSAPAGRARHTRRRSEKDCGEP